jgi:3-dehydro-L-gulonate 2-dehydrogenase
MYEQVTDTMQKKLTSYGTPDDQADLVSKQIARNSLEGVHTHGINRFPRLIRNIKEGIVKPGNTPTLMHSFQSMENYDGQLGLGIVIATFCMERAMDLAAEHGIALVALRNTNHWFRRRPTVTRPAMRATPRSASRTQCRTCPPGSHRFPSRKQSVHDGVSEGRRSHVIVDSAMSQFSYGALELAQLEHGTCRSMQASIPREFDEESGRSDQDATDSPHRYWKGAAMSFVLTCSPQAFRWQQRIDARKTERGRAWRIPNVHRHRLR